jgi:hypothetical protein
MTKAQYLEMCNQLGSEPLLHEIPVEFSDFPSDVQVYYMIYSFLPGKFEGFSGGYFGKDFQLLQFYFDLYDIDLEDRKYATEVISLFNNKETEIVNDKAARKREAAKKAKPGKSPKKR